MCIQPTNQNAQSNIKQELVNMPPALPESAQNTLFAIIEPLLLLMKQLVVKIFSVPPFYLTSHFRIFNLMAAYLFVLGYQFLRFTLGLKRIV